MSEVQRISYKTVSKAELGLSKSNMTHIGYATNFIDEWKKKFSFKTKLTIFFDDDKSTSITSLFINDPIENPDGSLRSPKFRALSEEETTSLRDSILYYYKLNMRDTIATPLLILFNLKRVSLGDNSDRIFLFNILFSTAMYRPAGTPLPTILPVTEIN